jgi:hypothetical protein
VQRSVVSRSDQFSCTDTLGGRAVVLNGGARASQGRKGGTEHDSKVAGEQSDYDSLRGVNASFASSTGEAALTVYP